MDQLIQYPKSLLAMTAYFVHARHLSDDRNLRKARLMVLFYLLTAAFLVVYGVFYRLIGYQLGFWACIYGASIVPILLFVFARTGSFSITSAVFDANAIVMFSIMIYGTGGINSSIVPWLAIIPATGFVFEGWLRGLMMSLVCFGEILALAILAQTGTQFPMWYHQDSDLLLRVVVWGGLVAYIFIILLIYETGRSRTIFKLDATNTELQKGKQLVEAQRLALSEKNARIAMINDNLEQLVAARTHKLEEAKKELDTFLYEASHALRRPMARIAGLSNLIAQDQDPEGRQQMLQYLEVTTTLMDQILHNLVAVSELNEKELRIEPLEVCFYLKSKLANFPEFEDANLVDLQLDFEKDLWMMADKVVLDLCLRPILLNALHYQKGNGELLQLRIQSRLEDNHVHLSIQDNGIGIPSEAVAHVKEMFYRATAQKAGGGLGLYLSDKAVQRLAGSLQINSIAGQGTTVTVMLPYSA